MIGMVALILGGCAVIGVLLRCDWDGCAEIGVVALILGGCGVIGVVALLSGYSQRAVTGVVATFYILFYSILFDSIPFYSIRFYSIGDSQRSAPSARARWRYRGGGLRARPQGTTAAGERPTPSITFPHLL